ncbi:LOW QUALITY PROTEIN: 12-(S)-hydroxy-5,8,10,14-eicosatetraenoic acid receptor [Thomomys bottae]
MVLPDCSTASPEADVAVGALLALECGLSLQGNAITLLLKVWKPYAIYLFNLVVADLLLAVCLPFLVAFYANHKVWVLGHTFCWALVSLLVLSRGVEVTFLAAVALDRYPRVVPRLEVNLLSPRVARGISGLVWLLMVALTHQSLLVPRAAPNSPGCPSVYPAGATWQETLFFLQLLLLLGLVLFCCTRLLRTLQKRLGEPRRQRLRRAQALAAMVLLLFALCFLPLGLARLLVHVFPESSKCALQRQPGLPAWCPPPALYRLPSPAFASSTPGAQQPQRQNNPALAPEIPAPDMWPALVPGHPPGWKQGPRVFQESTRGDPRLHSRARQESGHGQCRGCQALEDPALACCFTLQHSRPNLLHTAATPDPLPQAPVHGEEWDPGKAASWLPSSTARPSDMPALELRPPDGEQDLQGPGQGG